jgi:hypothetical protein
MGDEAGVAPAMEGHRGWVGMIGRCEASTVWPEEVRATGGVAAEDGECDGGRVSIGGMARSEGGREGSKKGQGYLYSGS